MRLVTSLEMKAIDTHAIDKIGIPATILMENAGLKILFAMEKALKGLRGKEFTIVCGKGNNGGDGLVVARHLFNNQVPIRVFITHPRSELSPDTAQNVTILQNCGYEPIFMAEAEDLSRLRIALEFSDVAIDAIYGTGFSGNIDGFTAEIVKIMNEAGVPKISVDLPSGLCASTGRLSNPAIRASYTITLGLPKLGLYLFPGIDMAGEIWVADIGIPQISYDSIPATRALLNRTVAASFMPGRPENSHKGTFGHLLILAGSEQYHGAGILSSYGALRSGVGLVTLGLPETISGRLNSDLLPDVISRAFPHSGGGFNLDEEIIREFSGVYRAVVAGPGWGQGKAQQKSVEALLKAWTGTLVLDADAINGLSSLDSAAAHAGNLILTPHLGELSRLTGRAIPDIAGDLPGQAVNLARKCNCTLVLKSAVTLIASADGKLLICSRPNSALAKGGAGDLLTGLIGGLAAMGLPSFQAAAVGVYLHAEAADMARRDLGADALTISEIASFLPRAFRRLRGEEKEA
jgi:NAD(P)H-hydrate epimerase